MKIWKYENMNKWNEYVCMEWNEFEKRYKWNYKRLTLNDNKILILFILIVFISKVWY